MIYYHFRAIGLWIVLTTLGNALAQSAAPDEAFQGLKWKDPVSVILKRFPTALTHQLIPCNVKDFHGVDCRSLLMSGYTVAGLTFDVTFYLTYSDKALAEVGLSSSTWIPSAADVDDGRASIISKCDDLQSLLAVRYGFATVTVKDEKRTRYFSRTVRWYEGAGSSNVLLTCFSGSREPSFTIDYSPKAPLDANKL